MATEFTVEPATDRNGRDGLLITRYEGTEPANITFNTLWIAADDPDELVRILSDAPKANREADTAQIMTLTRPVAWLDELDGDDEQRPLVVPGSVLPVESWAAAGVASAFPPDEPTGADDA